MTHLQLAALALLAEDGPHNSGPDFGKASPFGLLVVVLLLISVLFLVRSMNRHLKKLPESFDREHPELDQALDDGTVVLSDTASEATGKSDDAAADGNARHEPGS